MCSPDTSIASTPTKSSCSSSQCQVQEGDDRQINGESQEQVEAVRVPDAAQRPAEVVLPAGGEESPAPPAVGRVRKLRHLGSE